MIDHYEVLGLTRKATKEEIKEAFRKLAVQYHPDKHSQSPQATRDRATHMFKRVSEAYEVLADDRKRAEYNIRRSSFGGQSGAGAGHRYGYGCHGSASGYYGESAYRRRYGGGHHQPNGGFLSKFENVLRFMSTRDFLRSVAFAGILLGGTLVADKSWEALWKMHNSGKSFEEALESIEKAKVPKGKM